ncbi:hypothetical protein [Methylophilus methylotrophus]|uniref:hypothetical protein n=1 Tax=Methylophilus methylotrophus TaxID=17 RepID=UPI00035D5CAB|nr:hypothetical protein [Methylophilus methylotrophus]
MFLKGKDYLSIWEVAHRWAGVAPDSTSENSLPEEVQYYIQKIVEGYWNSTLRVRRSNGGRIPRESAPLFFFNLNIWQKHLEKCFFDNVYDKSKLNNYYINRSELFRMCESEDLDPPDFWKRPKSQSDQEVKANSTHRPQNEVHDRLVCQAIAKTYWDIDPKIHPAHMAKSRAINLYANGKHYKDESTIKNWITEVDPLKGQRKAGRPKDVDYLIDLENGVLSPKIIQNE